MVTKIQRWGNSQGLRVSKEVLERAHITVGDTVDVNVRKDMITIQPVKRARKKYTLKELLARMPKGYKPMGEVWGRPMGHEVW